MGGGGGYKEEKNGGRLQRSIEGGGSREEKRGILSGCVCGGGQMRGTGGGWG